MAEYYSSRLRDIANKLKVDGDPVNYIRASIMEGAANRIDDLQKNLAGRLCQIARMQDELDKLRKK